MATHISDTEPVIDAATIAGKVTGIITALGAILAILGFGTDTEYSQVAEAAGALVLAGGGLVGAILPIINAFKARAKVTPLVAPRDAAGFPLTPVGE